MSSGENMLGHVAFPQSQRVVCVVAVFAADLLERKQFCKILQGCIYVDKQQFQGCHIIPTSQSRQWKRSKMGGGPHRGEVAELEPSRTFRLLGLGFSEGGDCWESLVGVVVSGCKGAIAPGCSHLDL